MNNILDKTNIKKRIEELAKKYNGMRFVIYGAGDYYTFIRDNFDLSVLNIVGISDKKFELSKSENPSEYIALTPEELKTFDFDAVIVVLRNDEKMSDFIEYQLLIGTKNEDKAVIPMFTKKRVNKDKECYIKELRLYNFIRKIADDADLKKIEKELIIIQTEIDKVKRKRFFVKRYHKVLYRYYKKMLDLIFANIDITKLKPSQEKKYRQFQLRTVEFCKQMTDFLEEQGIEYFISSGTLIGAMRHKGFVPWDDDFDTGVLRKDYERLKKILKENFTEIDNSKVSVSKKNRLKIIDKALRKSNGQVLFFRGIEYIQLYKGKNINDCVSMDIFSHDYYRDEYTIKEHLEYIKYLRNKRTDIDNFPKIIEFLDNERKNNPNIVEKSNTIYYGIDNLGGYIVNPTEFMKEDTIYPRKKMIFEGYEFFAPHSPEGYTEIQYKNFMSFPKEIQLGHDGFNR